MIAAQNISSEKMEEYCKKGIAAVEAVDQVRKRFIDPLCLFEEELLIEIGFEFEKQRAEQEKVCSSTS